MPSAQWLDNRPAEASLDHAAEPTPRLLLAVLMRFERDLQHRLHQDGFTDVTVAQTNVLRHLDADGMRQSALARDAQISKQAVSQAVRALAARDLVKVERDPDDARAKRVVYTDRGRSLIQHAIGHILAMESAWQHTLGEEGYQQLRSLLIQLEGTHE